MPLYFAYGSNMSPRQMAERCPGARPLGPARLEGWRFHITTRGSATIIPGERDEVHGVVWRCEPWHLHRLDAYEGVRWRNYRRRWVEVHHTAGSSVALTYVSSRIYRGVARSDYVLTAVLPGGRAFSLPETYLDEIAKWLPSRPIGAGARRYRGRRRFVRHPR